jgi:hypothetical protein
LRGPNWGTFGQLGPPRRGEPPLYSGLPSANYEYASNEAIVPHRTDLPDRHNSKFMKKPQTESHPRLGPETWSIILTGTAFSYLARIVGEQVPLGVAPISTSMHSALSSNARLQVDPIRPGAVSN